MPDWLIFLAVILLLGTGWIIGRYQTLFSFSQSSTPPRSSQLFKGLNYLINEQPDQAIHYFVNMLEEDSESIDLQMVLAKLFRKQGEIDRAIIIHQRLLARPNLSDTSTLRIHIELAQNFYSAGLYDRAEQLLLETVAKKPDVRAIQLLFSVWSDQQEWLKIINQASSLKTLSEISRMQVVAACCEMAELNDEDAFTYLDKAERYKPNSLLLNYRYSEAYLGEGAGRKALKSLRKLISLDQSMIPIALPLVKRCFESALWGINYRTLLEDWFRVQPSMSLVKELLILIIQEEGEDSGKLFLIEYLKTHPSIPGLVQLVNLHVNSGHTQESSVLCLVRELCDQMVDQEKKFQCQKCGYQTLKMYWQCPGCRSWESVKPVYGLNSE